MATVAGEQDKLSIIEVLREHGKESLFHSGEWFMALEYLKNNLLLLVPSLNKSLSAKSQPRAA